MLIGDFHCHTVYSRDCCTTVTELVTACRRVGVTCLAVTDHNEIEGAFRVRDAADFDVIPGEEIFTAGGEVIGLFLRERIPPGLPFRETMLRIKDQGGVVYLPHPVSGIRKSQLSIEMVEENVDLLDVVEVFNSRTLGATAAQARWLEGFVRAHDLVPAAASDAHSRWEVGNVLIQMEHFSTPAEFLESLRGARITSRPSPLWMRGVLNHRVRAVLRRAKTHVR